MKEILFRGKRTDNGKWIEFTPLGALFSNPLKIEVELKTVEIYTGLTDKNGKKIFEGDICKHRSEYSGKFIISVVMYTDGCFLAMSDNNHGFWVSDRLEVIGNIHDNPELLKEIEDTE